MSRSRHKARASGGAVAYSGGDSNVMKEAKERKRGGGVSGEGEKAKARMDHKKRATGGAVTPGRKRGGSVGSNLHPLSTAAKTTKIKGEEAGTEGGGHKGENVSNP